MSWDKDLDVKMSSESEKSIGGLKRLWRSFADNYIPSSTSVIYEGDSVFHHITITEKDGIRTLHFGERAQESETSICLSNPESPIFEYPGMFFLALALTPKNKNILMLGLGGGYIPNIFRKYLKDHHLTVIEVDPLVVELAGIYFGFEAGDNVKLVINDGLEFLLKAENSYYDQIWLDAFNGNYIPEHLCHPDFLAIVKLKLAPEGLAVQNLHQAIWNHYHLQIRDTIKVFNQQPLLLSGTRSSNTVCMSINSDDNELPSDIDSIIAKVKGFGRKVGPYDLTEEAQKLTKN
jgi:spermidine synthase